MGIGSLEEKKSVACNLIHAFKVNIYKHSGFNKTQWEKFKDALYDLPTSLTIESIRVIVMALVTSVLVYFGIQFNM